MTDYDALADVDVESFDRHLTTLENSHPDQGAVGVLALDVELRTAYRRALVARDEAAAFLVDRHDWSYSDTAQATCGHRSHAERMHVVVGWTRTPDQLERPGVLLTRYQHLAVRLRQLMTRSHTLATRALPCARIEPYLPEDPVERVAHCAQWLRFLDMYASSTLAARHLHGAILVRHHNWRLDHVASIARADAGQIAVAGTAAQHSPPSDADSDLLRELAGVGDVLAYNSRRLSAARAEAVSDCLNAGVPRRVIEAYGGALAT
ncbi:hypothetical protein AB0M47_39835 [Hamadaea sp. NPDC051192]|uniref:hypothetical protein n=1 Tax=Hamadaea sp. NPDC051192 TaxID=3154940 RepID=UPI00341EA997